MNATSGRIRSNARIASSAMSATMNLQKPVGADLTKTKNYDKEQVQNVVNLLGGTEEANKVFYNTGGLQLKNSLSGQKSHGH